MNWTRGGPYVSCRIATCESSNVTGSRRTTVRIFLILTVLVMVGILVLANRTVWPALEDVERQTAAQHVRDVARLLNQRRELVAAYATALAARFPDSAAVASSVPFCPIATANLVVGEGVGDRWQEIYRHPSTPPWTTNDELRVRALMRAAAVSGSLRTTRWPLSDSGLWIAAAAPQAVSEARLTEPRVWVAASHLPGVEMERLVVPRGDRFIRLRQPSARESSPTGDGALVHVLNEDWLLGAAVLASDEGTPEAVMELEISRAPFHRMRGAIRFGFLALLAAVAMAGIAAALAADRAIRMDLDRRRTDERFRAITESVPDAIIVVRGDRVVAWNPAAERIFGRERGEVLGRPLEWAVGGSPSEPLLRVGEAGEGVASPREVELRRADGERFPAEITGGAWTTDEGSFQALVVRDISARKAAELERARIVEHFQQAQRLESLGVLAGGIAHDFNNLLAVILGRAEMAATAQTPEEMTQCLEAVRKAGQRASELIRQMLMYAGRAPASKRPLDLSAALTDARGLLESAAGRAARLELRLDAHLPQILADPGQIVQAAVNLVMNAAEAMDGQFGGRICFSTVSISGGPRRVPDAVFSGESETGGWVGFEVSDQGPGIPPEHRDRIFEPFFSTRFQGRGLGLPVVAGIVRAHGGALKLSSETGRGTTVTVLFPVLAAPANPAASPAAARPPSARTSSNGVVLVVDDDPLVRDVAARMLRRLGAEVETADSGASALEAFARRPSNYLAVLLDWTMPDLSGQETLRRLREIRPDVRVIVASGFDESLAMGRLQEVQTDGFLPKPFHFDAMARVLATCGHWRRPPADGSEQREADDHLAEPLAR